MHLFEIHIQFDLTGYLLEVVYAEEFSQEFQLKLRIDLHERLRLCEITHCKVSLKNPFLRPGTYVKNMKFRSFQRVLTSIRKIAFEPKLVYFFVCTGIEKPGILTSKRNFN
jgi:hypothetical protein